MKYDLLNQKMTELMDDIFQSIKESVAIESVRSEPLENAPYGIGPKKALDHMLLLGEKLGFKTKNVDNHAGWVEYGEGEEMVGILGHVDVVPLGEGWDYDPLGCEIHNGKMYGRGVMDDKGPTVAALYALKAIRDLHLPIDRRIRVIFGADEENGSSCMKHYVESGEELPTLGFTPDSAFPVIYFEKTQRFWELSGDVSIPSDIKVLSIEGGTAPNIVTQQCTMIIDGSISFKPTEHICITTKNGRTILTSTGTSAHGSTPECGVNAAIQLFQALRDQHIVLGGDLQTYIDFILDKIGTETNGNKLTIRYFDEETGETSVCLGRILYTSNHFSFTLDTRFPECADIEHVETAIPKLAAEVGLNAKITLTGKKVYVPKESELVQKLMNVYRIESGRNEEPLTMGGGTYAKSFDNMVSFGPFFLDEPDVIHQPNEHGNIDNMIKSYQIIAAAMLDLAQK